MLFLEKLLIDGGARLCGEVRISGAKNAAVAIIPAVLLVEGKCRIENIPDIKDVDSIIDILTYLGAEVDRISRDTLEIDSTNISSYKADCDRVRSMRASYYLLGVLLGRFGNAYVRMPGGCNFGERPIDQHIKGFEALGANVEKANDVVFARSNGLKGGHVYLDVVSVGATINIMLAACRAAGTTVIENAAREPHVVDVANFLNAMGANIIGAGTDSIRIIGTDKLHGGTYSIIPDQIEAGTFMVAAAATGGDVTVTNIIPKHMESLSAKLVEAGAVVEEMDDSIRVIGGEKISGIKVKTMPYPGFPTDLQPQIVTLLCKAEGKSTVTEGVWASRFQYIGELKRMGAKIELTGNTAIITGSERLLGAQVNATDLRAGAGLVIAGLMGEGTTEIYNLQHIDRGYEKIESKLISLGANIRRVAYEPAKPARLHVVNESVALKAVGKD